MNRKQLAEWRDKVGIWALTAVVTYSGWQLQRLVDEARTLSEKLIATDTKVAFHDYRLDQHRDKNQEQDGKLQNHLERIASLEVLGSFGRRGR